MHRTQNQAQWEKEIAAFEALDRRQRPRPNGIVFVGSSTIRLWKTLGQDFPGLNVINRGFGGSVLADSTYFAPRIVIPYRPRQVILFAGTNDINAKRSPRQVAADFMDFAGAIHAQLPRTQLAYIELTSSPSRWNQRDAVIEANQIIQRLCARNNLAFIPVRERLFGPNREPRPELFIADQLHLNSAGYKILADSVRPFLLQ
jgi:lysophospholipase L1-like esterase